MKTITLILMTMVFLRLEAQTPESATDSVIFRKKSSPTILFTLS
jgi:hypothetical protein